jgi:hypothetical protein
MTHLQRLPYCWRVSRYQPELRARETPWESWTDRSDVGAAFNGIVLTREEYERVEGTYAAAVTRFAIDAAAAVFRIVYVGHSAGGFALTPDQRVVRSDLAAIVRGNLRGDLDCALESVDAGLQIAFGYDLYVYVAASSPCERAVSDAVRDGLWLEPGASLPLWDDGDVDPTPEAMT